MMGSSSSEPVHGEIGVPGELVRPLVVGEQDGSLRPLAAQQVER
jgi:hypothetical protein